jgi:hypothetical protein
MGWMTHCSEVVSGLWVKLYIWMQSTHLVILIHLTSEDGSHREFQNVVGKLASHIMQKPINQEKVFISQ